MQVEMQVLAEPADRANDFEHVLQRAAHSILHVRYQTGQATVRWAEVSGAQARMSAAKPDGRLPYADVADVDTEAHSVSVLQPLRHLDEPARLQARRVLKEDGGAIRPLAKMRIELPQRGKHAVRLAPHVSVVVDDQTRDPSSEAVGEFPDRGAALLVEEIDAAVQVNHRQARMGRRELQDIVKLARGVGVHLGGQAHLGEAEPGQLEYRIIPRDALLE